MYIKKIAVLILIFIIINTLSACDINNEEIHTEDSDIVISNLKEGELEQMNALKFIQKMSKIDKKYDANFKSFKKVFGTLPKDTGSGVAIPTYYSDDIYLYLGVDYLETSATLSVRNDVNSQIALALYDYDEVKLLKVIENNLKQKNLNLIKEIENQNSNGIIESITDLEQLVVMLSEVKQNSTVEELVDIFGKAPKDISDGVRDKFVYYAGDVTIVLYDSPFTYMELYVHGGSVKVMFSGLED